ncbi:hypothetical protein V4Y02_23635, partial [Escherichia coli]
EDKPQSDKLAKAETFLPLFLPTSTLSRKVAFQYLGSDLTNSENSKKLHFLPFLFSERLLLV